MIGLFWGAVTGTALLLLLSPSKSTMRTQFRFLDLLAALALAAASLFIRVPALSLILFVALVIGLHQHRIQESQRIYLLRSQAWPDAIDFLVSSLRAGMTIGSSLVSLTHQGPEVLREVLKPVHESLSNGGTVQQALTLLKQSANDPVADRIVIALEISQHVGGTSLISVLRSLSSYIRAESRTRAELLSRQSWTVNAAKLAATAPWLIVLLLSLRAHEAYATTSGSLLLLMGAAASFVGYLWMRNAARLPLAERLG